MGKCKKRMLSRAKNDKFQMQLTRQDAVKIVMEEIEKNPASANAKKLISLFGISAEELSESGMTYEVLRSLDGVFN